jgi:hypothetical protein
MQMRAVSRCVADTLQAATMHIHTLATILRSVENASIAENGSAFIT